MGNKSQLIGFRDMLVSVRDKVSELKKEGKSLEAVVATKPTADYDANGEASLSTAISLPG